MKKQVAVIGAGAWGTALALLLAENGNQVTLWSSSEEKAALLRAERRNPSLPAAVLPENMGITASLQEAAEVGRMTVLAVASVYTRQTARRLKPYLPAGQLLICTAKGIEERTLKFQTEQVGEALPQARIACLSGPSHAEEVVRGLPTTCVAGAEERETAEEVQALFMNRNFRVYTSPDLLGIELGGAIKNVIALAAGIADGLGYGDNTKAALITRGIAELTRLGIRMGASAETFAGLTGIGDLIVTCASMHSRNRRAGILIGKGRSPEEAMREVDQVVEGVYSARAALALAEKYAVAMPIVREVNRILFEGKNPEDAVRDLMLRDPVEETSWRYPSAR
ncbi:MAG: NAD(P)H-dependent glycerol-3-phosphate dehydrogenase [Stomatobaculum sp.]